MEKKAHMGREEFLAHFPETVSEEIMKYIEEDALPRRNFIFTKRVKSIQTAYCTKCNKQYLPSSEYKEKTTVKCEKCQADCVVRASGRSRNDAYYRTYIVYYEKSLRNPEAITATGYWIDRDYRKNYIDVKPEVETLHRYLFQPGEKAVQFDYSWGSKNWLYQSGTNVKSYFNWSGLAGGYGSFGVNLRVSFESIEQAVSGTPFQYSMWNEYWKAHGDMTRFFALYSQSPCVEYLTKLGMSYFVHARLGGGNTYGAINWRGKTVQEVLKMSKQQFRELSPFLHKNNLHPLSLRLQQLNPLIPLTELNEMAKRYDECFQDLKKILGCTSIRRADNYICKQYEMHQQRRLDNNFRFYSKSQVVSEWKDYMNDCLTLEMDLKEDSILFPRDLHKAHQETIKRVKYKADAELNKKIADRLPMLRRKYLYQKDGFLLRPIIDTNELITEGNKLHHCVGGYSKRYADGECVIMALRMSSRPDTPFFTMQITRDSVTQCRGLNNCDMTPMVKEFVNSFVKEKLEGKKKDKNVTKCQEAAV